MATVFLFSSMENVIPCSNEGVAYDWPSLHCAPFKCIVTLLLAIERVTLLSDQRVALLFDKCVALPCVAVFCQTICITHIRKGQKTKVQP